VKGRNQKPARTLEIAFEGPSNGAKEFIHETADHVKEYVLGDVHTNGIEDFWALLKRRLKRTYVAAEPREQPWGQQRSGLYRSRERPAVSPVFRTPVARRGVIVIIGESSVARLEMIATCPPRPLWRRMTPPPGNAFWAREINCPEPTPETPIALQGMD